MKNVFDLIVPGVTFAAWLTYTCPPLVEAKSATARRVRVICGFIVSAGIGWSFGSALGGVL
jgi:hypothetical protein